MATDIYNDGDRVFVRLKGYPPWPALVKSRIPGKVESYNVFFYGTYDSAKVKPDVMYPYNEETKVKYGKPPKKGGPKFKQAMDEIENNLEILAPESAEPEPPPPVEPVDEEDDGELVIDEAVVPPPVLKKEGKLPPPASSAKKVSTKKEKEPKLAPLQIEEPPPPTVEEPVATPPPSKQPRRGSKGSKKDLALVIPATPEPSAPAAEVVSRSGRKIKPKRFADEEVQFSTPPGAKPSPTTEEGKSVEVTPAKRPKRTSSVGSKTPVPLTPTPEVKPEVKTLPPPPPLERPKLVAKRANPKRKVSTDAAAAAPVPVVPAPPLLTRPPPPLRAMPTLIPAPSSPSTHQNVPTEPEVGKSEPVVGEKPEAGLEKKKIKVEVLEKVDEDNKKRRGVEDLSSARGDSSNSPTPGDLEPKGEGPEETDDEGTEKENNLQEEEPMDNYENGVGEDSDEASRSVPKRMKVDLKNGTASAILSFNHDRPTYFRNEAASMEYDMGTARSVLNAKTQLEVNETAFLKSVADSLPPSKDEQEIQARLKAEQIQKKVAQLRMEGEMVETIGELVGSLGTKFAFCDRALDLLDKMGSRTDINTLALKKNPEVVQVIRQIQNYHGNVSQWPNLNPAQIEDFHVKAEMIREKAISIYQSFKLLFCTSSPGKPFYETFNDELEKFNDAVTGAGISESGVIGLFDDPTGVSDKPPTPESAIEESPDSAPNTILADMNGGAEEEAEMEVQP